MISMQTYELFFYRKPWRRRRFSGGPYVSDRMVTRTPTPFGSHAYHTDHEVYSEGPKSSRKALWAWEYHNKIMKELRGLR